MSALADGGGHDVFDPGGADFAAVGALYEGHGEIETGAGPDAGVEVADVKPSAPIDELVG